MDFADRKRNFILKSDFSILKVFFPPIFNLRCFLMTPYFHIIINDKNNYGSYPLIVTLTSQNYATIRRSLVVFSSHIFSKRACPKYIFKIPDCARLNGLEASRSSIIFTYLESSSKKFYRVSVF